MGNDDSADESVVGLLERLGTIGHAKGSLTVLRTVVLILTLAACIGMFAPSVQAQRMNSIVPRAITVQTFALMTDEIGLSHSQHQAAVDMYEDYCRSYAAFWANDIDGVLDELRRHSAVTGSRTDAEDVRWFFDTQRSIRAKARMLDRALWNDVQAILSGRQLLVWQRVVANMFIWRYGNVQYFCHPLKIQFVFASDIVSSLGPLSVQEEEALVPIIASLEDSMTQMGQRLHDEARSTCIELHELHQDTKPQTIAETYFNHGIGRHPRFIEATTALDELMDEMQGLNDRAVRRIAAVLEPLHAEILQSRYHFCLHDIRYSALQLHTYDYPGITMHQVDELPGLDEALREQLDARVVPLHHKFDAALGRAIALEREVRESVIFLAGVDQWIDAAPAVDTWLAQIESLGRLHREFAEALTDTLMPLVDHIEEGSKRRAIRNLVTQSIPVQSYHPHNTTTPRWLVPADDHRDAPWSGKAFHVRPIGWPMPLPLGDEDIDTLATELGLDAADRRVLQSIAASGHAAWNDRPVGVLDDETIDRDLQLQHLLDIDRTVFDNIKAFVGASGAEVIDRCARQRYRKVMMHGSLYRFWIDIGFGNAARMDLELGLKHIALTDAGRAAIADLVDAYSMSLNERIHRASELRDTLLAAMPSRWPPDPAIRSDRQLPKPIYILLAVNDPAAMDFRRATSDVARLHFETIQSIAEVLTEADRITFERSAYRAMWPGQYRDSNYAGGTLRRAVQDPSISAELRRSLANHLQSFDASYETLMIDRIRLRFEPADRQRLQNEAIENPYSVAIGRSEDRIHAFQQLNHRALQFVHRNLPN